MPSSRYLLVSAADVLLLVFKWTGPVWSFRSPWTRPTSHTVHVTSWHGNTGHLCTKGHKCEALIFSVLLAWTNCWTTSRLAGDLRFHSARVAYKTFKIKIWYNRDNTSRLVYEWWSKTLTSINRIIPIQHHGCFCPGSLRRQDIYTHDIELRRIGMFLSYTGKDFDYLCHVSMVEWYKL